MNKGALQFMKLKKEYTTDELFIIGYILGMKDAFKSVLRKNVADATDEELDEIVDDAVTYNQQEEVWHKLADELELDVRDFEDAYVMLDPRDY